MYFFSTKPQICPWHCHLGHNNNIKVIQTSKLVDKIDLGGKISSDNGAYSSNFELDKEDAKNELISINKAIDSLETIK